MKNSEISLDVEESYHDFSELRCFDLHKLVVGAPGENWSLFESISVDFVD